LHRHVERRAPSALARRLECDHLRVGLPFALVPALADDLAAADDDRADHGIRVRRAAPSLGDLERSLQAHVSSWISRRYARGRSSRAKIDVPATKSVAPASCAARMLSGPMPPSTWMWMFLGSNERAVRMRSSASGMNSCPE